MNLSPRPPISATRNGASASSVAVQTLLIVLALQHAGINATPEQITALAGVAATMWAFVAGAIARVCRDELHAQEQGVTRRGVVGQILLTLGSALA